MSMTPGANPISNFLMPTANGSMLFNNPYLDQAFDMGAEKVQNAVNSQFSLGGRYGSGAHQDVTTQGLNELATQIYGGAYENERGRQMQAAGLIQGGWESDLARILGSANQYGSTAQQQIGNMMGGAQGFQDAYSGGMLDLARVMAVAPQAYEFATAPGQTLMEVGGAYEQQAGQQLQDLIDEPLDVRAGDSMEPPHELLGHCCLNGRHGRYDHTDFAVPGSFAVPADHGRRFSTNRNPESFRSIGSAI